VDEGLLDQGTNRLRGTKKTTTPRLRGPAEGGIEKSDNSIPWEKFAGKEIVRGEGVRRERGGGGTLYGR